MDTKQFNKIIKMAEERKELKNKLSQIEEKMKKEFESIDAEFVETGDIVIDSIKYDLEVDETVKEDSIKWKQEFEKYVKSKKEDFKQVVKKISKKYSTWQKRNYRIIEQDAKNKACRHVLHSQSVVGDKIK